MCIRYCDWPSFMNLCLLSAFQEEGLSDVSEKIAKEKPKPGKRLKEVLQDVSYSLG